MVDIYNLHRFPYVQRVDIEYILKSVDVLEFFFSQKIKKNMYLHCKAMII